MLIILAATTGSVPYTVAMVRRVHYSLRGRKRMAGTKEKGPKVRVQKGEVFLTVACSACEAPILTPTTPIPHSTFISQVSAASRSHLLTCTGVER